MRRATVAAFALAALAALASVAPAAPGDPPRIRAVDYFEDYEMIGKRYNVSATVKGKADSVTARFRDLKAKGKLSNVTDTKPRGKVWFFRDKKFVKAVRTALESQGKVKIRAKAKSALGVHVVRCRLVFEPDPQFGDSALGDCKTVAKGPIG